MRVDGVIVASRLRNGGLSGLIAGGVSAPLSLVQVGQER